MDEKPVVAGGWASFEAPENNGNQDQSPVRWVELVVLVLLVALCDLTIYRGHGFAGYGLLFVAAPALIGLGVSRPRLDRDFWVVGALLVVLAAKLVWCGSWLLVGAGFALVVALAAALAGQRPYVLTVAVLASQTIRAGCDGLNCHGRRLLGLGRPRARSRWLEVALPLVALVVFGTIFVVANPNVLAALSQRAVAFFNELNQFLLHFSPLEAVFWVAVLWIGTGLLRPNVKSPLWGDDSPGAVSPGPSVEAPLYAAYRNTLVTVILLFAVYLVFEFQTLWFHEFPKGFYYSGYAHAGAAWLTFALALATAVLSVVFGGRALRDPRLPQLRRLAWIWSAQNFVLAVAVYNRLCIYVGFNGMTRLRVVGFLGITAVVVGFALVLRKIARNQSFALLIHRQLWTLALAVYLYAVLPVDWFVVRYNVRCILAGDLKPSVQITVQPISAEGLLSLKPLLECRDATIRGGVRALLSMRQEQAESLAHERESLGWTSHQIADLWVLDHLRANQAQWNTFPTTAAREKTYVDFAKYVYQWF